MKLPEQMFCNFAPMIFVRSDKNWFQISTMGATVKPGG